MNVNEWGPGGWIFLHTLTFNYPLVPDEDHKKHYRTLFGSLENILPCKYCRESFKIYTKYLPLDDFLDSREGITYWLFRIHNLINQKIFKNIVDFIFVVHKYEKIRAGCSKLIRDGDKDKSFNTCQNKQDTNNNDISIFVKNAEDKYKITIDNMINKLYLSDDNPNKEYLEYIKTLKDNTINKYNILYK